jgi:GT2 family glycosyltransferase
MTTTLFYKFDFNQENNIEKPFSLKQEELVLVKGTDSKFKKEKVAYSCSFIKAAKWEVRRPTIIICIKDNAELLRFTLDNLTKNDIHNQSNIIIVDDRSTEDIKSIVLENSLSYVRVDNDKGFNFSMLNNIGAYVANKLGTEEIVLWNSDLWTPDSVTFQNLLNLHRKNNSTISGTKLIYPPKDLSFRKDDVTDNIKNNFSNATKNWRRTIQFGGSAWYPCEGPLALSPLHHRRFKPLNDLVASDNKQVDFVTGAFQIIDLDWFLKNGGLNPSLSKNFQDVDMCLTAFEEGRKVSYNGEHYLLHDESLSLEKEGKQDHQLVSDHVLFGKIWNNKIAKLIF